MTVLLVHCRFVGFATVVGRAIEGKLFPLIFGWVRLKGSRRIGCCCIRIVMLAPIPWRGHARHPHDLVLTWQSSQSIGGLMIRQGLAFDQWLHYLWSPLPLAYCT